MKMWKEAGVKVIPVVASAALAKRMELPNSLVNSVCIFKPQLSLLILMILNILNNICNGSDLLKLLGRDLSSV